PQRKQPHDRAFDSALPTDRSSAPSRQDRGAGGDDRPLGTEPRTTTYRYGDRSPDDGQPLRTQRSSLSGEVPPPLLTSGGHAPSGSGRSVVRGAGVAMKTTLDHLPELKRSQIQAIAALMQQAESPVEMVVLFGSYARGDWVEDPRMATSATSIYWWSLPPR